jgi:hypothetical protein
MLFGETVAVYCENHTELTDTVRTSHETHFVSATENNRLMLFGETVAVYCENHTELTDTLCGRHGEWFMQWPMCFESLMPSHTISAVHYEIHKQHVITLCKPNAGFFNAKAGVGPYMQLPSLKKTPLAIWQMVFPADLQSNNKVIATRSGRSGSRGEHGSQNVARS